MSNVNNDHLSTTPSATRSASSIVVGSAQSSGRKRRLLVIGLIIFALIGGWLIGGWLFVSSKNQSTHVHVQNPKITKVPSLPTRTNTAADYANFQSDYDAQIAAAGGSPAVQAELYTTKAELYVSQRDYKNALIAALKVNELQPNDSTNYSRIAGIYEMLGDKKNAIQYYQKSIDLIKADNISNASGSSPMQQYYQNKINQLEKKP